MIFGNSDPGVMHFDTKMMIVGGSCSERDDTVAGRIFDCVGEIVDDRLAQEAFYRANGRQIVG